MKREETITVRLGIKAKVGLDMLVADQHIATGKNMTLTEAIWYLLQEQHPEIIERIEKLEAKRKEQG